MVSLAFIVAINTFARGGGMAMLRYFSGLVASPFPLYSGTTLAVRQEAGGS